MNLYLVTNPRGADYDHIESFVVCCESEQVARQTNPKQNEYASYHWIMNDINLLKVEHIGVAVSTIRSGIIIVNKHDS